MVTKAHILQEIKRTVESNGGNPLGEKRFETETGIKRFDWFGKYWARWSEVVTEAGFVPERIHVIQTDDPSGIEAYWHKRFEAMRKKANGSIWTQKTLQRSKDASSCRASFLIPNP
jgi:hypothetical protein